MRQLCLVLALVLVAPAGCSDSGPATPDDSGPAADLQGDGPGADEGGDDGPPLDLGSSDAAKPKLKPFPLPASLDLGGEVSSVAVADLDDDGYLDLVAIVVAQGSATLRDAALTVAWGDAAGSYKARTKHKLGQAFWTRDSSTSVVAVGDLNGDGRLDLATAGETATAGAKARTFSHKALPGGDQLLQPVLLVRAAKGAKPTLYRGTKGGKVERCAADGSSCVALPGQPEVCPPKTACPIYDLVQGDFDGDGAPDIVGGGEPSSSPFTYFSRAWLSSAQYKAPLKIVGLHAVDMEAGDVDGDGVDDVVAQQQESISDFPSYTDVWIATPGAAAPFKKIQTIYNFDNHNDNAALADMDGDGCLDLMLIGVDSPSVGVRLGAKLSGGGKTICSGLLGPHDPQKPADAGGWKVYPGFASTIGIQQIDVNGDGQQEWVIRTGFNTKSRLHFVALP